MSLRRVWSMEYRDTADLERALISALPRMPREASLVVGVPRSGLLPATLLALHLNLPITDVDGFIEGRVMGAGMREMAHGHIGGLCEDATILIVDDSVGQGVQMRALQERLKPLASRFRLVYVAVYVTPAQQDLVDIPVELLQPRRCFSWNIMHHPVLRQSCVELEGVLMSGTNEPRASGFGASRENATRVPSYAPTVEIGCVISRSSPRSRPEVEAWLASHRIRFRALSFAGDAQGPAWRDVAAGFSSSGTNLLITADQQNAGAMARHSGLPVLSVADGTLHKPSPIRQVPLVFRRGRRKLASSRRRLRIPRGR